MPDARVVKYSNRHFASRMPRFVALALALSIVARSSAARVDASIDSGAVSYTHLTLPTKA